MGLASLGGVHFRIDPSSVQWDFQMKTVSKQTVGGKVVQVFGTHLGDMIVTGALTANVAAGDTAAWEAQERFMAQMKANAERAEKQTNPTPLRFIYPPRKWDFNVYLKDVSPVRQANEEFAPKWELTLFIVEDRTRVVVKGIRDLYIKRLMNGIGWKQTRYNGPSQRQVDALLAGRNFDEYIRSQFEEAAAGAADNPLPLGSGG